MCEITNMYQLIIDVSFLDTRWRCKEETLGSAFRSGAY